MRHRHIDDRPPGKLAVPLALAIDAGDTASAGLRQMVAGNNGSDRSGSGLTRLLPDRYGGGRAPRVSANQIRRSCDELDAFALALDDLNEALTRFDSQIEWPSDAASRLWSSTKNAAPLLNELNDTLARLGRLRVKLILKRPLDG